ncbi:MAG: LCP family protein [Synergistaceae bacterium]|nr:LCP family protein [Synergistaceae bacterium]
MKILKAFLIALLILAATVAGAAWRIKVAFDKPRMLPEPRAKASSVFAEPEPTMDGAANAGERGESFRGVTSILLVGLDDTDGSRRSDAIALAFFNREAQSVHVISIPRDSRVFIPSHGWDKVNHAYVFGGVGLLKETLWNLLNEPIDYFATLNYDSFPRMIDLIGGVDLYVEKKMVYSDFSGKLFINIPEGQQHLNGKRALEYVRFRHDPLGDLGRIQRQQKFISAVMEKLKSPSMLLKVPELVNEVVSAVNTDLTPMDALKLANFTASLPPSGVKFIMAPGKAAYIGNLSYWVLDIVELSKLVAKILAGEADDAPVVIVENVEKLPSPVLDQEELRYLVAQIGKIGILNGDGADGLGKRASQIFQRLGVDVAYTGNAKHFDYHSSNVAYPINAAEGDREAAEALARLCGIANKSLVQKNQSVTMVSIILGHDKETLFERLESVGF